MNILFHPADERGRGEHDWLSTRYSFSFAGWHDPSRMGFGALRVINDDRIAPASGFGKHGHRDMEIITIVMKGAVTHEDSIGSHGVVPAGDVQVMSAGTGVIHSEFNRSPDMPLELFQIWIEPNELNAPPRYAQRSFGIDAPRAGSTLLVSPNGEDGSLPIRQDAFITLISLGTNATLEYALRNPAGGAYVFAVSGSLRIEAAQRELGPRAAAGIWGTEKFTLAAATPATALIIEVPRL